MLESDLLNEARVPHLSAQERAEVAELLARLAAECAEDVQRVILYGSKARGDADGESDVDLLIVANNGAERIEQVVEKWQDDYEFYSTPFIDSANDYEHDRWLLLPFYVNVRRDGIELWDENARLIEELETPLRFPEGIFRQLDEATREVIRIYVERAKEDWEIAALLREKGSPKGAITSAYDASYRMACATLYAVNVVRGKHKAMPAAISEFLVEPGLIEPEYLMMYKGLMRGQVVSEYSGERGFAYHLAHLRLSDDESSLMLADAEKLIARMEQFLRERGAVE